MKSKIIYKIKSMNSMVWKNGVSLINLVEDATKNV